MSGRPLLLRPLKIGTAFLVSSFGRGKRYLFTRFSTILSWMAEHMRPTSSRRIYSEIRSVSFTSEIVADKHGRKGLIMFPLAA